MESSTWHRLCNLNTMIDLTSLSARPDTSYTAWENAGKKAVMRFDINDRTAGPIPTFGLSSAATKPIVNGNQYAPTEMSNATERPDIQYEAKTENDYSFGDVIDMINPLQHLPVIGMIYRNLTGDTIKPISNIIGGTIFGGPVGAVASTVNSIVKIQTGKDVAENALSLVGMDVGSGENKKTNIQYNNEVTLGGASLEGTTLALANLSSAPEQKGPKNFAGQPPSSPWNRLNA